MSVTFSHFRSLQCCYSAISALFRLSRTSKEARDSCYPPRSLCTVMVLRVVAAFPVIHSLVKLTTSPSLLLRATPLQCSRPVPLALREAICTASGRRQLPLLSTHRLRQNRYDKNDSACSIVHQFSRCCYLSPMVLHSIWSKLRVKMKPQPEPVCMAKAG